MTLLTDHHSRNVLIFFKPQGWYLFSLASKETYLNSKIISALLFVSNQQFPSFHLTFCQFLTLRESDLCPSCWRNKSAFLQFRSSVEHCGWQILKLSPSKFFCPLNIQSNANLGSSHYGSLVKDQTLSLWGCVLIPGFAQGYGIAISCSVAAAAALIQPLLWVWL